MPSTPLFSTYSQGENRITSSMLAVFEYVGLPLFETIPRDRPAQAVGHPALSALLSGQITRAVLILQFREAR
ncbi:hypothetical protein ABZ512_13020 [Nocardiopsis dassonvillei]|uniref:hypothetical protein n=1 Tax=Nocardiopsis dassonvillei TaxID=2014 RepID=UPI00340C1B99